MGTTPTSEREVTIHYVDNACNILARRRVTLGQLACQCQEGKCPMGIKRGQTCQVSPRCKGTTPALWANYIRLYELDELGR